jgi:hypothetical protein
VHSPVVIRSSNLISPGYEGNSKETETIRDQDPKGHQLPNAR